MSPQPPFATPSVRNAPQEIDRPGGAQLSVPQGFKIEEFATGGLNTSEALFWLSQLLVAITGGGDEEAFEAELRGLGVAQLLEWAA